MVVDRGDSADYSYESSAVDAQTHCSLFHVVVLDGGDDEVPSIAALLGTDDPRGAKVTNWRAKGRRRARDASSSSPLPSMV